MWILVAVVVATLVVFVGIFTVVPGVSMREVPDTQRLAIFRFGTFRTLGGPGPTKVMPVVDRAIALSVDDVGAALEEGRAQFGRVDVPVRASAFFETGEAVRIIGFDRDQAAVIVKA